MNHFMVRVKGNALSLLAICAVMLSPVSIRAERQETECVSNGWETFHAVKGNCSVNFPARPQHHSDKVSGGEGECELSYDAYVAAMGPHSVFMLMVASYPDSVDESYAQLSLEAFLNGILTYNPANQLLAADLVLVDGKEALDFCIRTGNVLFKGRAIMMKNSLYLMAMESEMQAYDETHYNSFVTSFKIVEEKVSQRQ